MDDKKYSLSDLIMDMTLNDFNVSFNNFNILQDGLHDGIQIRVQKDFHVFQTIVPYDEITLICDSDYVLCDYLQRLLFEFYGIYPEYVMNVMKKG